jgi:phage shock protein PspC (stress-responsive transcriptional regulator)
MPIELRPDMSLVVIVLVVWEMIWKGLALYLSARDDSRVWFVAILFINSAGILPILYLLIRLWKKRQMKYQIV